MFIYYIPVKIENISKSDLFGNIIPTIKRNDEYPIRCTLQYIKTTDTNNLSFENFKTISKEINKFYENSIQEGSLVLENPDRKTTVVINEKINNNGVRESNEEEIDYSLDTNKDKDNVGLIDGVILLEDSEKLEIDELSQELEERLLDID